MKEQPKSGRPALKGHRLEESHAALRPNRPASPRGCRRSIQKIWKHKLVAEELGIPERDVKKYVKFDRLPKRLKELYEEGKVKLTIALKATDAATSPDGIIDEAKAEALAIEMGKLTGRQHKIILKLAQERPAMTAEELLEEAKKPPKELYIKLHSFLMT